MSQPNQIASLFYHFFSNCGIKTFAMGRPHNFGSLQKMSLKVEKVQKGGWGISNENQKDHNSTCGLFKMIGGGPYCEAQPQL